MLVTILLLGLLSVAATTDLLWHKIYNWTTYPGMVAALAFHGVGSAVALTSDGSLPWLEWLGWVGVGASALGLLLCGFAVLVCYVFFRVGGGDVKLMAMIGAWLGYEQGLVTMLWTFVLGACAGLIVLVWRVGAWRLTKRIVRQGVYILRIGGWSPLTPDERAELQPPLFLAPCAFVAAIVVRMGLEQYMPIF